jgi:hypothetical protein
MSASKILSKTHDEILGNIGIALLQTKNTRRLTLDEMGKALERDRQMVAHYISGDNAMDVVTWFRATAAWPELSDKLAEADKQS